MHRHCDVAHNNLHPIAILFATIALITAIPSLSMAQTVPMRGTVDPGSPPWPCGGTSIPRNPLSSIFDLLCAIARSWNNNRRSDESQFAVLSSVDHSR